MEFDIGKTRLTLVQGDIATQRVDAVVNAANAALSGGGGVDGAIHRAAGPSVLVECRTISGGCPTGRAVATGAGNLVAKRIIHAVGPVWSGGKKSEPELLASAYRESLRVAMVEGCRTVAFPAISAGAYRFPIKSATEIAVSTTLSILKEYPDSFDEVRFVVYSDKDRKVYEQILPKAIQV